MATFTVKKLKKILEKLPDNMPVGLWDLSTDDFYDGNYGLDKDNFIIEDYVKEEGGKTIGKGLFIVFDNKLNQEPIND